MHAVEGILLVTRERTGRPGMLDGDRQGMKTASHGERQARRCAAR